MLVDQIGAGGVGVAGEVAGDRVVQDAALVGGVAVIVAVGATEAALGGGAGDDRSGTHRVPPPGVGSVRRCRCAAGSRHRRPGEGVVVGAARTRVGVGGPDRRGGYSESTQAMVVCSRWS